VRSGVALSRAGLRVGVRVGVRVAAGEAVTVLVRVAEGDALGPGGVGVGAPEASDRASVNPANEARASALVRSEARYRPTP
jgi:hypothetical protein